MAKNAISPTVAAARSDLGAAKRWHPAADHSDKEQQLKAAVTADRLHKVIDDIAQNPYDEWADRVCAALPPMTDEQIAAAARVLSKIEGGAA